MGSPGKKIEWYLDELVFIKKNFNYLSATELLDHINKNRVRKIGKPKLREKYRQLGLQKHPRPELWLERETRFLLNNYHKMGNVEICKHLNNFNNRSRSFTNKIIWKKMWLLNIKRTQKDLARIKQKNIDSGAYTSIRYGEAHYIFVPEGKVRIFNYRKKNRKYKYIKHHGKMIPFHRFVWEQNFGTIPEKHRIYFKDGNSLNCKPENLICSKGKICRYKKDFKSRQDVFLKHDQSVNKSRTPIHQFNYKCQTAY